MLVHSYFHNLAGKFGAIMGIEELLERGQVKDREVMWKRLLATHIISM